MDIQGSDSAISPTSGKFYAKSLEFSWVKRDMTRTNLDNKQKIDILLKALEERYKVIHIIRERIQAICLWSLGILLTAAGWLIQSNITLILEEKVLYSVFIFVTFLVVRFYYLGDLHKGFKNQQRIAARIETALQFYNIGTFDSAKTSIYPKEWENSGDNVKGNFFKANVHLLDLGTLLLILAVWLQDCF